MENSTQNTDVDDVEENSTFAVPDNSTEINLSKGAYSGVSEFERTFNIISLSCTIIFPIIIIGGTVLNILSFIVMRRGSLKEVSTCFYMSILALADTGG